MIPIIKHITFTQLGIVLGEIQFLKSQNKTKKTEIFIQKTLMHIRLSKQKLAEEAYSLTLDV